MLQNIASLGSPYFIAMLWSSTITYSNCYWPGNLKGYHEYLLQPTQTESQLWSTSQCKHSGFVFHCKPNWKLQINSLYTIIIVRHCDLSKIPMPTVSMESLIEDWFHSGSTPCLTSVNELLDIHFLYRRGKQRVKTSQVCRREEKDTLIRCYCIGTEALACAMNGETAGCIYLFSLCRHWRCHLWPVAGTAGILSQHLWRPGAAAALRFLPVEERRGHFMKQMCLTKCDSLDNWWQYLICSRNTRRKYLHLCMDSTASTSFSWFCHVKVHPQVIPYNVQI